jgi:hypothetical protein
MTPGRIVSVVDLDNMLLASGRKAPRRRRQIVRQFLERSNGSYSKSATLAKAS